MCFKHQFLSAQGRTRGNYLKQEQKGLINQWEGTYLKGL